MALLLFILNTASQSANNPNSKLFLPKQLADIDGNNSNGKLLPLEEDTIKVGDITGPTGATITQTFGSQWFLLKKPPNPNGDMPIPNPETPYPVLILGNDPASKVTIDGLNNVYVRSIEQTSADDDRTTFHLKLDFGFWDASNGGSDIPALKVSSKYQLSQKICLGKPGSKQCSPGAAGIDIDGEGTVDINILNARLATDATVTVTTKDNQRILSVALANLTIEGASPGTSPQLDPTNLTIDNFKFKFLAKTYKTAAINALSSPDASAAIFKNIQDQLNSDQNLGTISNMITDQLQVVMNDLLGAVDGALPQVINEDGQAAVDLYLYDRVFYSMNNTGSTWFLPRTLCGMKNPAIEPYSADKISLGDIDVKGIIFANAALSDLKVTGLSNLSAPAKTTVFRPGSISTDANLAAYQPPPLVDGHTIPAKTQVTAKFSADASGVELDADVTVKIIAATLQIDAYSQSDTIETLDVTVSGLKVKLAALSDMTITAKIATQPFFEGMINSALNSDGIKTQILSEINAELGRVLPQVSKAATALAKSIINTNIS